MTAAPDIFISYAHDDAGTARLFADALATEGFDVWWDDVLRSGEVFDEAIESALRAAKAVIVLWSPHSVSSRWVRAEATLADRNKTLVPVTIAPCERPIVFELFQTAELSHWKGAADDTAWQAFVDGVRHLLGRERAAPAPMPSLATIASKSEPSRETLLAVLPFDNLSSDSEMEFFSDGVSDDILGRILRGSKIRVIGRTSSFQFRGAEKPRAAAALGASHVLDGSIRRAGNKVRIAAQLTEAASQTMLWSDKYDRDLEDIFAVQDEISEAIADALDAAFFPSESRKIDPAIYDLYLRAKSLAPVPAAWSHSISLLEAVTAAAPDFADAWGRRAFFRAHLRSMSPYAERTGITAAAYSDIAHALALDPNQSDAKFAVAAMVDPWGAFIEWDRANRDLLSCAGGNAHALTYCANFFYHSGAIREAVALATQARDLDPKEPMCYWQLGLVLSAADRPAEANAVLSEGMGLAPDNHYLSGSLVYTSALSGDFATVDRLLDPTRLAKYPLRDFGPRILPFVSLLRNPSAEAVEGLLSELRRRVANKAAAFRLAYPLLVMAGRVEEAYDLIDAAILGPTGAPEDELGLGAYMPGPLFTARLAQFRADPRFVKLCARLGLVEYWLATQKWPDCADEVPYDFRAECEKYRDHPKDVFFV